MGRFSEIYWQLTSKAWEEADTWHKVCNSKWYITRMKCKCPTLAYELIFCTLWNSLKSEKGVPLVSQWRGGKSTPQRHRYVLRLTHTRKKQKFFRSNIRMMTTTRWKWWHSQWAVGMNDERKRMWMRMEYILNGPYVAGNFDATTSKLCAVLPHWSSAPLISSGVLPTLLSLALPVSFGT